MTATASRVRIATTTVTCVVLNKGHRHLIEDRPTIQRVLAMMQEAYASGKRVAPTVLFKNGQSRKLVIGEPVTLDAANQHVVFKGHMANGNDVVNVLITLYGDKAGHVEICD